VWRRRKVTQRIDALRKCFKLNCLCFSNPFPQPTGNIKLRHKQTGFVTLSGTFVFFVVKNNPPCPPISSFNPQKLTISFFPTFKKPNLAANEQGRQKQAERET
jgi:hypothetical protein